MSEKSEYCTILPTRCDVDDIVLDGYMRRGRTGAQFDAEVWRKSVGVGGV
jgi:hypothetical protein